MRIFSTGRLKTVQQHYCQFFGKIWDADQQNILNRVELKRQFSPAVESSSLMSDRFGTRAEDRKSSALGIRLRVPVLALSF
jgi:hypothetical protein